MGFAVERRAQPQIHAFALIGSLLLYCVSGRQGSKEAHVAVGCHGLQAAQGPYTARLGCCTTFLAGTSDSDLSGQDICDAQRGQPLPLPCSRARHKRRLMWMHIFII